MPWDNLKQNLGWLKLCFLQTAMLNCMLLHGCQLVERLVTSQGRYRT